MALQKLTQIDGGGISTTSDYQVGVVTTRGIKGIGIFSGGSVVHSGVITASCSYKSYSIYISYIFIC